MNPGTGTGGNAGNGADGNAQDPFPARRTIEEALDKLAQHADRHHDVLLSMTTAALQQLHNLYPEADALRLRGTPEQQARVAINNAIAKVFAAYMDAEFLRQVDEHNPDSCAPS